jgi:predicted RNase H-like nuclease (RuvC/YqgF family)
LDFPGNRHPAHHPGHELNVVPYLRGTGHQGGFAIVCRPVTVFSSRIALDGEILHDAVMSEDAIGELKDELKAHRHQIEALRALKDQHKKEYEALKEVVDRHEEAVTEDAKQIALLQIEIEDLKKQIKPLKEDIHKLVELVWCLVYRLTTERWVHVMDGRHGEMAQNLAEKHGVVSDGIRK